MPEQPLGPSAYGVERFTVPAVLDLRAQQFADRPMMVIGGTPVTFAQMRDRSCAAANVLLELGLRRGQTVALFAGTCPEWVYFWLGAARIGAVTAAVNAANKGEFLTHPLRLSRAKIVVCDAERLPRVQEVADQIDTLDPEQPPSDLPFAMLAGASTRAPDVAPTEPDEPGTLFFTSGTTGPSKAVVTTWHYLFSGTATIASAWEFAAGEVFWTAMPFFHISAATTVLAPMLFGGTSVVAEGFHPSRVCDDIKASGAIGFAGVGAMVAMLWNQPPDPGDRELGLRFISAAPVPADLYRRIEERYDCRIVTMYGLTEALPVAIKAVSDGGVPGTSGRVNPMFDVRVVDADGNPVPPGVAGEIICRPKYPHVMSEGYASASPGGTELRIDAHPDWFRTGDLGRLGEDRQLSYIDRLKDSLRRRGENVSSVEVETTVMRHPAVGDAAAVTVPSDVGEDDILILVTVAPSAKLDPVDLLDFCAARMPYFCVPRYVEFLDEIPKNGMGRVRKDLLRTRGLGSDAWDREAHGYVLNR